MGPSPAVRPATALMFALASGVFARAGDAGAAEGAAEPAPESLSLRQAVERAVRGNIDLRREGITLRTTEANIVTALGSFDFVLAADGTFTRRVTPPVTPADLAAGATESLVFDLSLVRALETGGQISLAAQAGRLNTGSRFTCGVAAGAAFDSCNVYNTSLALNFTHPLLRGFGREVAEANLRRARIARDQELLNRQARAANVLRDTITTYWELAFQTSDLEIRQSAVALAEQQLRTTLAQIQVGRMGELQAAAVRRAIADDRGEVEASRQQLAARALDLLRLLGTPVPRRFLAAASGAGLRAADATSAQPHEVDADAETARALAASPALKALQKGIALSDVDLRVALVSLRPQLDFSGTIGRIGRNIDFGESVRQLFRQDETVGAVGLVFSLPLQNRAARGAADAARAAGDNARLTAEDLELAIRDAVARLSAQIRSASRRIDLAHASVGFAQQNLEAERARFQVGQSTNNDVLLRQQELKQAQINGVRAAVDLLVADVAMAALTGDVLETYGVTLRGL